MITKRIHGLLRALAICLLLGVILLPQAPRVDARQAAMPSASRLLAGRLAHMARRLVRGNDASPEALEGALILAEAAGELDTGNPEHQRLILEAANLLERRDTADRAIRRLIELEPNNTVAQLSRLNNALDQYQDVESRTSAYEQLLRPATLAQLHPSVASRLATDLALIRQREGNTDAFADWLTRAMTLDASNPIAASVAVEFFDESEQKDPVGRAELLINLVMTNPTDHLAQVALGRLLLEEGAYAASARVYDLAAASRNAAGLPAWLELEVDRAISYWGSGSPDAALRRIDLVERMLADTAAQEAAAAGDDAAAPVTHPSLLAIKAALSEYATNVDTAANLRSGVVRGYESLFATPAPSEFDEASRLLEAAWIAIWLLEDTDQTQTWLDRVRGIQPLTDTANARFSGWIALREGDADQAARLLQRVSEDDDAARLGMAIALEQQGNPQDAARTLLDVARRRSGTIMGVWASNQLSRILNQRVPLTATATRLEGLISAIPTSVDRYPDDPRMLLALSIRPTKRVYAPFEPVFVEVELSNRGSRPLAIGPEGPIRPHMLLQPTVTTVSGRESVRPPEVIVDLSRTLRLEPREAVTVLVELRRNCLDTVLGDRPLTGALLQVEGVVNFIALPDGRVRPGLLGVRAASEGFRVRGVSVDESWFTTALTVARDTRSIDDVQLATLLTHAALRDATASGMSTDDIIRRVAEGFAGMRAEQQAWVLSVLPPEPQLERILAAARPIDHPLVRTAYLVFQVEDPSDPMLDAALRSEGPRLRQLAEIIRSLSDPDDADSSGDDPANPDDTADDDPPADDANTVDDDGA